MPASIRLAIPTRFFMVVGLLSLLGASSFLLLIFGPASYEQVQALNRQTYHEGGYQHLNLAATPARYQLLRGSLVAVAGVSCGLLLALSSFRKTLQTEAKTLSRELQNVVAALGSAARQLPGSERWVGGGLLALILALRLWYLAEYVLHTDEVASYDYFVRPGPLTISCFYPIPNNHLLFSFCCWPLSLLSNNVRLVMRLPTFMASTVGTVLGYALLIRWGGFRVATLATGLFSVLPMGLYYAVAGRGYFLQLTLLLLAFFGALAVLQAPAYRRLGWVALITGSILGFYTIPTFLYPFVSLWLGLLAGLGWQRRGPELGHLVLAGGVVGSVTVLLYLPVLCVSGWQQLAGNRYVAQLPANVFWPQYLRYLRILADMLAGNGRVGLLAGGGLLALGPGLLGQLPRPIKAGAALAWLLLAMPLLLMAVQQVQVPARVLLYTSCFGCLLGSVVTMHLLNRLRMPGRYQLLASALLVAAYGGYQFGQQLMPHQDQVREQAQMQAAYAWLTRQHNPRTLLAAPDYELFFRHYALQQNRPLLLHTSPAPGQTYDVTIQAHRANPLPAWALPPFYVPAYQNSFVVIYKKAVKQ